MDIIAVKKELEISYYNNLQIILTKNNINYEWIDKHIKMLSDEKTSDLIICTEKKNLINENKPKIQETVIIGDDENLYKKPWSKLNAIHKILKIKEFVNELKIRNEQERIKLKDQLVQLIKDKVLTKKDKVNYDSENGKIVSLIHLKCDNNEYIYEIC